MENEEKKEIIADEVVVDETPVVEEQPSEVPSEEPSEAPAEEVEKEEVDTASSENPSAENEDEAPEENGDKSEDTPSEEKEGEGEGEPEEEPSEEPSDAPADEDEADKVDGEPSPEPSVEPNEELEKVQRELAQLKEKEETRKLVEEINTKAIEASNQFDDFADKLSKALEDTFKQYGIDTDKTIDEIRAIDPAKAAIAQELIGHAEAIRNAKIQEFQAPIIEAQKNLVFREAAKVMCEYDMTDAQAQEAANSLINIINQVGINDIEGDLKAKVELAVARAKFVVKDEAKEEKSVQEEGKVEEQPKQEKQVEEVAAEVAEAPTEEPSEEPTEAPTEEPKADLEAFKEGASTGDVIVDNNGDINIDNVIQKLNALPYKERINFYQKHAELIKQAGIRNYKNRGLN